MEFDNEMKIIFNSNSKNESFARVSVASFIAQLDPTVNEINDIKTAVSEAVTNAIIHGYENNYGKIFLSCGIKGDTVYIKIKDNGIGIEDIEKARQPLYTSKPDMERSGMGFTVMECFMDNVKVKSAVGKGTVVYMDKKISCSL